MLKRIFRHALYLSAGEAFSKIFGMLTTIYLFRAVETEAFGAWNFVLAVYAFFHFLTIPGSEIVASGHIARRRWTVPLVLRDVFYSRGLLAAVAAPLMVLFVMVTHGGSQLALLAALQALNLFLLPVSIQYALIGMERMDLIAVSKTIQGAATLALVVLLVHGPQDITLLPLALLGGTALSLLPVFLFYSRRFPCFLRLNGFVLRSPDLRASVSVTLALFMITVYYQAGLVALEYLKGSREVGLFAAGFRIALFLSAFQIFVNQSYFPFISKHWESGPGTVRSAVEAGLAGMIAVSAIMTAAIELFAGEIATIFYHADSAAIASGLRVTVLAMTLVYVEAIPASILLALGRRKEYLLSVTAGAVIGLAVNVLLIPILGFLGAAWAFAITEAVVFLAVFSSAWRTARFRLRGPAALAGVCLAGIPLLLLLPRAGGMAVYAGLVALAFVIIARPASGGIRAVWSAPSNS